MIRRLAIAAAAVAALIGAAAPAAAERLVTSISRHQVMVTSSFTGTAIVLFGTIEPDTPAARRRPGSGGYDLTVVVSVGASLFDDRYGLARRAPRELVEMPFLANDRLDPERTHGDLLLSIEAEHPDTVLFALRQLMRRTRRTLVLRWVVDGFTRGGTPGERTTGSPRNLLGFIDGTANLDTGAGDLMRRQPLSPSLRNRKGDVSKVLTAWLEDAEWLRRAFELRTETDLSAQSRGP